MALDLQSPPISIPLATDAAGVIRVAGTRVTLDSVIARFDEGATAEEIRDEVQVYLSERARAADETRLQNETVDPPNGIRERLLARRTDP